MKALMHLINLTMKFGPYLRTIRLRMLNPKNYKTSYQLVGASPG